MYVLVELSSNKRRYFETAENLAGYMLGRRVAKYRVEVYKYAGQVTELPANVSDMIDRLQYIASR